MNSYPIIMSFHHSCSKSWWRVTCSFEGETWRWPLWSNFDQINPAKSIVLLCFLNFSTLLYSSVRRLKVLVHLSLVIPLSFLSLLLLSLFPSASHHTTQFGYWAGQLGDGRAVMLGEYVNRWVCMAFAFYQLYFTCYLAMINWGWGLDTQWD